MAHANPEFALGCRAYRDPPLATQLPPPASLNELRARMREIGRLIAIDYPVSDAERHAYGLWRQVQRQDREPRANLAAERAEPAGAMHTRARAGERFVEPKRRYPSDVQAGRVRTRRGTLPV